MARNSVRSSGGIADTIKTVVFAVLVALAVRTFLFEPFNIPSSSMEPTLLIGDYLFVSKYSYGYSHLSILGGVLDFDGRIMGGRPKRGEVAVFKLPRDGHTDYIKRIIGLPGDTVRMTDGVLYVNDKMAALQPVKNYNYIDGFGRLRNVPQYIEDLPEGRDHLVIHVEKKGRFDNTREVTVPPGHYFMMCDNRDNSADSRTTEVGFVPEENLVGRAEVIWFSIDGHAKFWEIWKWPTAIRYNRLFSAID